MAEKINDLLVRIDATTESLRRQLKLAESATQQTANRMDRDLQKVDRAFVRSTGAQRRFGGSIQQMGFQVGDFAVQLASGQNALVAFTQQGSQLAGAFGPGGAALGAVLAIGGAVAGYFVRSMGEGEKATDALADSLKRLDRVIDEQDGIQSLTDGIRELARESEVAARARIVSAMAAAEEAARQAARGIRDAIGEVGDLPDVFSVDETDRSLAGSGRVAALNRVIREFRDELGLIGDAGTDAARQIFDALKQLDADPTIANFRALESTVSGISTTIGESSAPLQALVAKMFEFFDGARTAAERVEYLKKVLDDLNAGRSIQFKVDEINTSDSPKRREQQRRTVRDDLLAPSDDFINQALAKQKEVERLFAGTRTEVEQIEAQIARVQELAAGGFFEQAGIDDQQILGRLRTQLDATVNGTEQATQDIAKSIANNVGGAFDEMFTSGKLSAENFAESVLRDLARITARLYIMKPLVESIFGQGGGSGAFGKAVFSAFGFAKGGSFTVGGSGGPDSQFVPLKLSPGERVDITPSGKSSGDGVQVNVINHGEPLQVTNTREHQVDGQRIVDVMVERGVEKMFANGSIDRLFSASGFGVRRRGGR